MTQILGIDAYIRLSSKSSHEKRVLSYSMRNSNEGFQGLICVADMPHYVSRERKGDCYILALESIIVGGHHLLHFLYSIGPNKRVSTPAYGPS